MNSHPAFLRVTLGGACLLMVASAAAVAAQPAHPRTAPPPHPASDHAAQPRHHRLHLSVPGHYVVYNQAQAQVRPTIEHTRARIVSHHFSTTPAPTTEPQSHVLSLGPGRYTLAAQIRFRPVTTYVVTRHREVYVAGGEHRADCTVTSVDQDSGTFTADCTSNRYPGQTVTYQGDNSEGLSEGDHVQETVYFHSYRYSRAYHLRERRYGTVRSTTLRRHVAVSWGGYRRRTAPRHSVATMHLDTSGPWTLEWAASCRENFPYFGAVATTRGHTSSFNGHVHGGSNTGHIRVPWSGAVTLHIYDAGCTWRLTELSRHPFRLA